MNKLDFWFPKRYLEYKKFYLPFYLTIFFRNIESYPKTQPTLPAGEIARKTTTKQQKFTELH